VTNEMREKNGRVWSVGSQERKRVKGGMIRKC
jgi:hypothetical protein